MNTEGKAIAAVLQNYEDALNQSSADTVIKLYTPDGVFMLHSGVSSVGTHAVREAYEAPV